MTQLDCSSTKFHKSSLPSQYGRLSSRKKGLFPNSLAQYVQLKHSGWKCFPMAFKQSPWSGENKFLLRHSINRKRAFFTYFDFSSAFVAWRSQKLFETIFAVEIAFLFNESNVLKWTTAISIDAYKVIWTPDTSQCRYKWSSVSFENY